jgi:NAD(P)H-hydrate epimerase
MAKMVTLTRQQVRRLDQIAIEELGIPGVVLMENAGRGCAEEILAAIRGGGVRSGECRVAVLCGGGNNGGDGYVIARHLVNAGLACTVYAAVDPDSLRGDARVHATVVQRMGIPTNRLGGDSVSKAAAEWQSSRVIVDALLGTGFRGAVRPEMAAIIKACNDAGAQTNGQAVVVAVDVPSGLDGDTGLPSDPTIKADLTVTFVAAKSGFLKPEAKPYLGRLVVTGIGTPASLIDRVKQELPEAV